MTRAPDSPAPRRHWTPGRVIRMLILLGFAVYCVIPLCWLLFAPTKTDPQLANGFPLSVGSLANVAHAWAHLTSFNNGIIYQWIVNSLIYATLSLVISITTAILGGYALATTRMPGRKALLILTLVSMIVPATALVLPLFLEINIVHLTNTIWSVVLPASFYPFGVYLSFIHFSTSLPRELLEAGRLDGCSEGRIFVRIALPLAKPLVALVAFFSFVANWNNYFLPYVMLSDDTKFNLPLGITELVTGTNALNPGAGASILPIYRPEAALIGVVTVLPVALLFIFAQRFLVRGILSGSVKN